MASRPRVLRTFAELWDVIMASRAIEADDVEASLLAELVRWMDMLNDKSEALRDLERDRQQKKAQGFARQWAEDRAFRVRQSADGKTQDGGIVSVAHGWDCEAPGAHPVLFTPAEVLARIALRDASRFQERAIAAVKAYRQYLTYGGYAQCLADRFRMLHSRESERQNLDDERRCPRCCSPEHTEVRYCPLSGLTHDSPFMLPTIANGGYLTLSGRRLHDRDDPWCWKCKLWGHKASGCVRCRLCNRHGHAEQDCASGFAMYRYVPPPAQAPPPRRPPQNQ
jgi:hypothetical protein